MQPAAAPPASDTSAPTPRRGKASLVRRAIKAVLGPYMRLYHHLELQGAEHIPAHGPALVLLNHASLLDVPALMVVDPFPNTSTVVKASMFKIPIISWALRRWGAIPVEREGRDSTGVRSILTALREGGVVAIAAEGRRTRSGRLEPINPVLARIAVSARVLVLPVGISGSFRALPPGEVLPRPGKIVVRVGPAFRFEPGTNAAAAAERIRREIAALLPPEMQPKEWIDSPTPQPPPSLSQRGRGS